MSRDGWKKELVLGALLVGFGLLVLPFTIYFVGQRVIGEYSSSDAGVFDLAENIWWDLLQLSLPAWTLVLAPYLIVQLIRVSRFLMRRTAL